MVATYGRDERSGRAEPRAKKGKAAGSFSFTALRAAAARRCLPLLSTPTNDQGCDRGHRLARDVRVESAAVPSCRFCPPTLPFSFTCPPCPCRSSRRPYPLALLRLIEPFPLCALLSLPLRFFSCTPSQLSLFSFPFTPASRCFLLQPLLVLQPLPLPAAAAR